jgi:hypothetical protein
MKRCTGVILCLFVSVSLFAKVSADSALSKPRTVCSFFVNTAGGIHRYPNPYTDYPGLKKSNHVVFPLDLRFYFLKNHLGFGYTRFTSGSFGGTGWYRSYHPMYLKNAGSIEEENIFFISYNFNLTRFQGKHFSPYFQINHGIAENSGYIIFGTAGILYHITKNISINASLNAGGSQDYEKYDLNLGLCISGKRIERDRVTQKQFLKSKRIKDSLSLSAQRFIIELGAGLYLAKAQDHGFKSSDNRYMDFYINTSDYYENEFVYVRRGFPLLSIGYLKRNQSLHLEGSHAEFSVAGGGDGSPYVIERTMETNLAALYELNDLASLWNKRKYRKCSWFGGVKLLFSSKQRDIDWAYSYYNGWGRNSNDIKYKFRSNSLRPIIETGFKWQFQSHVYMKMGVGFNTICYMQGNYYSQQHMITYPYGGLIHDPETFDEEKDIDYKKWITPGGGSTFKVADNIFFKLGYSF